MKTVRTVRTEAMKEIDGLMKLYADATYLNAEIVGLHQDVSAEVFAALAVAYLTIRDLKDPSIDNEITAVDVNLKDLE